LKVPVEEYEEETYFNKPLIEEPEELDEVENPILEPEPYISSEESKMARQGEREVHNVNGEQPRIGGGRRGNKGTGRGGGRGSGRGENINRKPFRYPVVNEYTTVEMENISPSILPNFYGLRSEDS